VSDEAQREKGYGNENGKLCWNVRSIIVVAVVVVWVVAVIADIVYAWYDVPPQVHLAMLGLVGYLSKDVISSKGG
jgi:hypothetical protein